MLLRYCLTHFRVLLYTVCLMVSFPALGQTPETLSSADIYAQLKKLQVLGSVLYVAAHPDDENNSFLPYLAKEKKYRTAYLSLTRGDGGQNLIGSEQGIELGLIRTQELLAARRIDGAEQYFSSAYEFGFSKTSDETLKIWNREKVLADMVWVIRKFQPDIIINRFPGDARAGHGHHAASAILSQEAFYAAADPKRFTEQLAKGVQPWQAKRLLWNTFNFGSANTTSDNQLKVDAGVYNALIGKSYGEIGGEARSMHKSQGEGRPRRKGPVNEFFVTLAGDSAKNDLMDGVLTDWSRIPNEGFNIRKMIDEIIANYHFDHPENSVAPLVELYKSLQKANYNAAWWYNKKKELEDLIVACSGLFAEATTDVEYAIPGEKLTVNFFVNKRNNVNIKIDQIQLNTTPEKSFDTILNSALAVNYNFNLSKTFVVDQGKKYSQPYWLVKPMNSIGNFSVTDLDVVGNAESEASYTAKFVVSLNDIRFAINKPVQFKMVDPVRGEVYQPLNVIPPVIVSLNNHVLLTNVESVNNLPITSTPLQLQFKTNFSAPAIPVTIKIKDENEKILISIDSVINVEAGGVCTFSFDVSKLNSTKKSTKLNAEISYERGGKKFAFTQYLKSIKYNHIPSINYFYKDQVILINDKIITAPKKVGYIIGAGDLVPQALAQLGYPVQYIGEAEISEELIDRFDVIIVGIRAFNIHEWLTTKNELLNKFVEKGGHLIVQYLKSNQVGSKKVKVGPYPFSISNVRVTEEDAAVNVLLPNHPFVSYPNSIAKNDFGGWVQERSTYQADITGAPYDAIFGMNDTNEKQTSGSLVTAKYGKGNFTYVSMVLFRQLPAGVAGSYRLFANIISLPTSK